MKQMANGFGTLGGGLAELFAPQQDYLTKAMNAMKNQGGSLSQVRKFIQNLQKTASPEERRTVFQREFASLLPSEQAVAGIMLQNMMGARPGGMGFAAAPSPQQWLGKQPASMRTALQNQLLGRGPMSPAGELPLMQLPPGMQPGQRGFAGQRRLERLTQRFPEATRLPEAWKQMLPTGVAEVKERKERALLSAKETGELDDVINEFKRWQKEGYMVDEAEEAAEVARRTVGPYGVDLIQVLLDEYVDPEWMKELDALDPAQRQLLGLRKDQRGRTRWQPSEDEPTRIKQAALLQIARTPLPTWRDVRAWRANDILDVFSVTFGWPGIEGKDMAQQLFKANKISLQEMPYIAQPIIKRKVGSQEYIDGVVALQGWLRPEQIKFVEWLAKNPDQKAAYLKLADEILKATGKKTIKEFLQDIGKLSKPGIGEKIRAWLNIEEE
jgi:hypothetical protein